MLHLLPSSAFILGLGDAAVEFAEELGFSGFETREFVSDAGLHVEFEGLRACVVGFGGGLEGGDEGGAEADGGFAGGELVGVGKGGGEVLPVEDGGVGRGFAGGGSHGGSVDLRLEVVQLPGIGGG